MKLSINVFLLRNRLETPLKRLYKPLGFSVLTRVVVSDKQKMPTIQICVQFLKTKDNA